MAIVRIGLDIAKTVFQVHGVDGHGKEVLNKKLSRSEVVAYFSRLPVCLIGLEHALIHKSDLTRSWSKNPFTFNDLSQHL